MEHREMLENFEVDVDNAAHEKVQSRNILIKRALIAGFVIVIIIIIAIIVGVVVSKKSRDKSSGTAKVGATTGCKSFSRPAVVLVFLHAFKPEYLKMGYAPNISKLATSGVKSEGMRSQFPTKMFPNIYTFFTGLYPGTHGIVSNIFWNANRTERYFHGGKKGQKTKWLNGDPIWVTAKSQGIKSAVYYLWDVDKDEERRPEYWNPFDGGKASYESRVDQVLSWLGKESSKRPYFLNLYLGEPDTPNQGYGLDETVEAVKKLDNAIGRLVAGVNEKKLTDCVNIVLVSDHGMANASCSKAIYLDQMISLENVTTEEESSFMLLYTKDKIHAKTLANQLKCKNKNLRVYSKYDRFVPKRLHYTNNRRIGDLMILPNAGWKILPKSGKCPSTLFGDHGYDNIYPEMSALLVAKGPSFKNGLVAPQFSSIEVYNLLADILKISPASNNGTFGSLSYMLKRSNNIAKPFYDGDGNRFSMNCTFPKDLDDAVSKCKSCVCSYCDYAIKNNVTFYRKSLDLSQNEIQGSLGTHLPWGVPKGGAGKQGCILTQKHYVIGYSGYFHIPVWVGYQLNVKQLIVNIPRKNCFRRDIRLTAQQSSFCADYSFSGFDRGHIAPSGDFNYDRTVEQDTFILSNIAPQSRYFNRYPGLWFKTEDTFRNWAIAYKSVYVLSGSIFDSDGDGFRDKDSEVKSWAKDRVNGVAVPTHFYKIIVRCDENVKSQINIPNCKGTLESLSFVLPHNEEKDCQLRDWKTRLLEYTASINDIERLTGSNLFPSLPYPFSAEFKSHLPSKLWPIS